MRLSLTAMSLVLACTAQAPAGAAGMGWLRLFGVGHPHDFGTPAAGPYPTEAELAHILPAGRMERALVYEGDGEWRCATAVDRNGPTEAFYWADSDTSYGFGNDADLAACEAEPAFERAVALRIEGPNRAFGTRQGIRIGMTLDELVDAIGDDFRFSVCACGFGGAVFGNDGMFADDISLRLDFPPDLDVELGSLVEREEDFQVRASDVPAPFREQITVAQIVLPLPYSADR